VGGTGNLVFVQQSTVAGSTSIQTGGADDSVIANRSVFRGNVSVDTGAGNDLTAFLANRFDAAFAVNTRSASDVVGLVNGNTSVSTPDLRGGSGTDTVVWDGSGSTPRSTGFESDNGVDLDNLIDLALSNFDDLGLDG
jgi:hypothetical protein